MRTLLRYILLSLTIVLLLVAMSWYVLPIRQYLGEEIVKQLQLKGIPVESLVISTLNWQQAEFSDITFEEGAGIKVGTIQASYDLNSLQAGRIRDLVISDVTYQIKPDPPFSHFSHEDVYKDMYIVIPTKPSLFQQIPMDTVRLNNVTIKAKEKNWELQVPFDVEVVVVPTPQFIVTGKPATITLEKNIYQLMSGIFKASLKANEQWQGEVQVQLSHQTSEPLFQPLMVHGVLEAGADKITTTIKAEDRQGKILAEMHDDYLTKEGSHAISMAKVYWQGGTVTLAPFVQNIMEPIILEVLVKDVPVEEVLQLLTKNQVTVTGTLAGTIPLTWHQGKLMIGKGELKTQTTGKLSIAPDYLKTLAKNNPQLKEVATAFTDFDYEMLEIMFKPLDNNKTQIGLRVRGNNKAVYEGRPIHLNINIGGDVEQLLMQSLKIYQLPNQLIQGLHDE